MQRASRLGLLTVWLLILCLVLAPVNTALGAAKTPDYKGHWAEKQIGRWVEQGYINGYEDGTFRPDQSVSRGEFVKLVNHAFGLKEATDIDYADLSSTHWAHEEARTAVKAGYISGYEDQTIRLDHSITRQEAAVIVSGLLHLTAEPEGARSFSDSGKLASWSMGAVGAAAAKGILEGYEDGSFKPEAPINRAEAVTILDKALVVKPETVYSSAGTYGPAEGSAVIAGNVAVSVQGVTLRNTVIEGNLLLAEGIGEGDVTLKNVTVKGTATIQGGGAHSVHLIDSVFTKIAVEKKAGSIRIVLEGTTAAQELIVKTEAQLETSAGSVIKEAVFRAVTTVKGQGTIERATLEAAAKGTTFEKQPSQTAGAGAPATGSTGSTGGSGGSGGSGGGGTTPTPEAPAVSGSVYGTVVNANQTPVDQAKVTVTGTTYFTLTNASGYYTLSGIPEGTYTLTITKAGFEALTTSSFEVKKNVRTEINAQLVSLPVTQYTISGEDHIILDEMKDDQPKFYPYQVLKADGQPLEEGQVEWSLKFPFEVTLPQWEMTYTDPAAPGYGLAIQPDTGVLHTGWYSWIGDFEVVAKSKADGSVLAAKTVRHSYNNVDRVVSTNGSITLFFLEEPEWYYYDDDGVQKRYNQNIDSLDADIRTSQNYKDYVPLPFTSTQYDEATNSVTFQFAPLAAKAVEQHVILQLGYIESTFLTYLVITVPAAQ